MEVNKFRFLYKQIDSKSLEDKVDNFWTELLRRYFYHDEFIITQNARPADNEKKKADFIIQAVSGPNSAEHVVLVEDKRPSLSGRDTAWEDAVGQLTGYMLQARDADKRKLKLKKGELLPYSIYGIVNIGKYSRFYVLHPHNDTLQDLPDTHGKAFHLKDNAQDIMKFLTRLVAATLPYVSSSSSSSSSAGSSRHGSPSRPGSSSGAPKTTSPAAGKGPTSSSGASAKPNPKP
ncbi:hypothetical protein C8A03DRAFT_39503 [Achaetomium macrosporum]|uniref:Uncharacterized protein n=1 Tax=Achaetomium macrosporum TaxID=79813 RepID=A0AAN7H6D1_9PEZI|nr:hypothetical protein C8A03DRAFT_39503 [Achaetomium macrosporum]